MINYKVLFFALVPSLIAAYLIWLKVSSYGVSIEPDLNIKTWQLEAHVQAKGLGKSARIELELPVILEKHQIVSENFISNGFAVALLNTNDTRKAVWTGRAKEENYDFYYRATIKTTSGIKVKRKTIETQAIVLPEHQMTLIKELSKKIRRANLDNKEFIEKICFEVIKGDLAPAVELRNEFTSVNKLISLVAVVLNESGIPARVVKAIKLAGAERGIRFSTQLEVNLDNYWQAIDYRNGYKLSDDWFVWRRSVDPLLVARNWDESKVTISITPDLATLDKPNVPQAVLNRFPSVQSLPIDAQALYSIILVIPVGALLVAFIRSIVGIKTLGTFMPVLVALSFRETELFWGISLYITVIILSLIVRYFFEHLQLLVVPRLTATMTLVVIVIFLFSCIMEYFQLNRALSVALFPIVILTMMIERISIIWEELGLWRAVWQTGLSLAVASLIYLVIANSYVQYYMVVFPELLLVILSISILLGRFTGYRLTELYRFRSFLRSSK